MASNGRFPTSGQTIGPIADPEQPDDAVSKSYLDEQGYAVSSQVALVLAQKADSVHGHSQSDVTGLVAALSGKADASHSHVQGDVTGLVAALAAKAASTHTHAQTDVTNLVNDLAAKAASNHTHSGIPAFKR